MSVKTNTIEERTADAGVTIDGLQIKDGGLPSLPGAGITSDQAAALAAYQVALAEAETGDALLKTAGGVEFGAVSGGDPYLEYVALLSQVGGNAPSAAVLKNTIGTITWSRVGEGNYIGTRTGAFPSGKTVVLVGTVITEMIFMTAGRANNNQISVSTMANDGNYYDDNLQETAIVIRVYP
ncbi:MAG: hypothetical protein IPM39_29510 [Chloroflexi bacterium]|nr:hypothetical protein [Chloroflexota bacterium]